MALAKMGKAELPGWVDNGLAPAALCRKYFAECPLELEPQRPFVALQWRHFW